MSDSVTSIVEHKSPNDELLRLRFNHIKEVWMHDNPFFLHVLVKEGIHHWYGFQRFAKNLDVVNSVKNRKGVDEAMKIYNTTGQLTEEWTRTFRYILSYVNELQIDQGTLNYGLVDITDYDHHDFCTYCDGDPPYQAYSNELARERASAAKLREYKERKAQAAAQIAEATRDKVYDEAYASGTTPISNRRAGNSPHVNLSSTGTQGRGERSGFFDNLSLSDDDEVNPSSPFTGIYYGPPQKPASYASSGSAASHDASNSHRSSQHSSSSHHKKKKKKKKKSHGGGGGGGGGGSSSSSSSTSSRSSSSIPSHVSASQPDGELEVYQTDVGNAYLEAYTKEKVFVIAGPEFHELEGHILVIVKALYGLKSSGLRWYERFADVLRSMGFTPCPAEPEIWMRAHRADGSIIWPDKNKRKSGESDENSRNGASDPPIPKRPSTTSQYPIPTEDGSYYEYIATYVDDLTIASKDAKAICEELETKHKFKLKGSQPLSFLLGCDYFYEDGVLCQAPRKYIEKMADSYERFFGEKPSKKVSSPLEKGDNPELDDSEFLDDEGVKVYQSMIGSAQWVVSIGRFDVAVHIMTLSSFRAQPRKGHLERIKRVYAYLIKMKHAVIRYRTDMPDVTDFVFPELDWSNTPYAGAAEELPTNLPPARGKPLLMTTFVDANLGHDVISGKSVTGVLHFFNKTPVDWFSKKQGTVETATFGSENSAARSAIEQIRANKLTLLYLGVPLHGPPILLGDNKSVVNSGTTPHQQLHKRHLMLSYHFVREAVAAGEIRFAHINGEHNPADVLSKHWGYQAVWPLLRPILFWKGDTMDIVEKDKLILFES